MQRDKRKKVTSYDWNNWEILDWGLQIFKANKIMTANQNLGLYIKEPIRTLSLNMKNSYDTRKSKWPRFHWTKYQELRVDDGGLRDCQLTFEGFCPLEYKIGWGNGFIFFYQYHSKIKQIKVVRDSIFTWKLLYRELLTCRIHEQIDFYNRPFYSCVLSCQAFDLEWGWRWPCCDRDQYLVCMITK